jgi:hypothetical protein
MCHPWLEHIQLVSQFNHVVVYALQLCHFYNYSQFDDYMIIHDDSHILKTIMCAADLVWPIFQNKKTLMDG